MLSREKESHCNIKHRRNNTVALTYDIQNTSTKLVMLNLSNKNENRLRDHSQHNEHAKDFRCCYCLSDTAPACACHHRDKDLSQYPRRHKSCSKDQSKKQKYNKNDYKKNSNVAEKEADWPSLTKAELITIERKSKKYQASLLPERLSEKDLLLLHSIPALSHPDFNLGQRRCLLSLARIYTNVSPGPRYSPQRAVTSQSKLAPLSQRSTEKKSRSKGARNIKSSKEENSKKRKNSLTTAVGIFQSEQSEISKENKCSDSKYSQESFYMADEVSENNFLRELLSSGNNDDSSVNNENERNDSNTQRVENIDLAVDGIDENRREPSDESKAENNESDLKFNIDSMNEMDEEIIDEGEFSNQQIELELNDYVINILKQQADILQLQLRVISSETSLANKILENEGLETNVKKFDYQEIPDNLLSGSKTFSDDRLLDNSHNKEEIFIEEEAIKPIKEGSVESNEKSNGNTKEESISNSGSIESNTLDKINPQIGNKNNNECIEENPLRILSEHLRQSISS